MAIFKCKMCGGSLEINNRETVVTCDYCGTQQTLPKLDEEKRVNMYDRANHFRRNNDYDKAMGIYEQILNEDKTDAEAYWSLVICRYGIEYVEDPASHKRVPTVNRAQFTSVYDDDNYKSALQYADMYQKVVYEEEAKTINEIQKGILTISENESPFDVFICYKETDNNGRRTQDSVLANDLYHQLIQEGFKVFFSRITLEDKLGTAYEPYIFAALNSSKAMVVLGTRPDYFNAVWVKNEWSRYLALIKQGQKKILIPAYKDMEPYDLPEEFSHLQAQDMNKLGFMQDLIRGIKKIVQADKELSIVDKVTITTGVNNNTAPLLERVFMFLEDGDWDSADKYCEKVLDLEPKNGRAYLGKLMCSLKIQHPEDLGKRLDFFDDNSYYIKAMRFADDELKVELQGYVDAIRFRKQTFIYIDAVELMEERKYDKAIEVFSTIKEYKDSSELICKCQGFIREEYIENYIVRVKQELNNAITEDEIDKIIERVNGEENIPEMEDVFSEAKKEYSERYVVARELYCNYLSKKSRVNQLDEEINSINIKLNANVKVINELTKELEHFELIKEKSQIEFNKIELCNKAIESIEFKLEQEKNKLKKFGLFSGGAKKEINSCIANYRIEIKKKQIDLAEKMQIYNDLQKEIANVRKEDIEEKIKPLQRDKELYNQEIRTLSAEKEEISQQLNKIFVQMRYPKYMSAILRTEDSNLFFSVMTDLSIVEGIKLNSRLFEIAKNNSYYATLPIWVVNMFNSKNSFDVEAIYYQACAAMENATCDADILWAMEQFVTISGYKDSDTRIAECKKK